MKFSFDAGEYRNNLANELRDARNEGKADDARKKLQEERRGLSYAIAEAIKRAGTDTGDASRMFHGEELLDEPSEISAETKVFKSADGIEHALRIQTFDISRAIPQEIQLMFDTLRLDKTKNIRQALYEKRIDDLSPEEKALFDKVWGLIYSSLSDEEEEWADEKRIKSISPFGDEADEYLTPEEVSKLYELLPKIEHQLSSDERMKFQSIETKLYHSNNDEKFNKEYELFVNKITDGDFLKQHMLSHVVSGFADSDDKREAINVQERLSHQNTGGSEKVFDVNKASSSKLWFHAGGAEYATRRGKILGGAVNLIIICDGESARFQNEIKAVSFHGVGVRAPDELLKDYEEKINQIRTEKKEVVASPATQVQAFYQTIGKIGNGGQLFFQQREPWFYIAKWIIDAYHGRLYKITKHTEKPHESGVVQ